MSATDDRTWAEIIAEAEGPSATSDAKKAEEVVVPEGPQTAAGETAQNTSSGVAQPNEQNKAKSKQKGKQNKQVTFVNGTAAYQPDPNAQAQTAGPAGASTDAKQTNVVQPEAQVQPKEKGGKEESKPLEQSPPAVTTAATPNAGSQAQPTTMSGPCQPLLIQPQAPQPTIYGVSIVPRIVHGKRQMYFERPHYNPPEKFKADGRGGRTLLPCFSRQTLPAAPVFMPQGYFPQQAFPPPQQPSPTGQPAPPTQPSPPAKASSVASSDSSKAASEKSKKEKKQEEKEKEEKKEDAPTTTPSGPPSPVTINIYTSNFDNPKVEASEATSAPSEKQSSANRIKKVKKQTIVTVETDDEEEQEVSQPTRAANKNKKIVKTTTVAVDEEEETTPRRKQNKPAKRITKQTVVTQDEESDSEAEVVAKTAKQNPTTVKKVKHTKKILVEEETPEDEVDATPVQKKSKTTKQADASSDTSAEQARPPNSRMMGTKTYSTKLNSDAKPSEDDKTAAKNNDDNSSINSSQRGVKPAAAPNNGPVTTNQSGWPGQAPWFPPPMYGGFGPQMWPGMFPPPPGVSTPPAQKPAGKAASKVLSVSSSSGTGNSGEHSPRHSSKKHHTRQKPASSKHGDKKDSLVPSHVGSDTPSDISIHMPRDWRGTISVKDPKPAKPSPEPATSHVSRPRTASQAPSRVAAEVLDNPATEKINVHINRSSPTKPRLPSKSVAHSNYQPPSAAPESPPPISPHRTSPDTSPKHARRVWQHPQHADVWEIYSISTRDEFDPGKDREIHPNDSVSQIASVVHEKKSGRRRETIESRSKEEWRGTDDKGRAWEVDVSRKRKVNVPVGNTARSRDKSTSEKVEKIHLSRIRRPSPDENKSSRRHEHDRDRSSQSTTRRSKRYVYDENQAPAHSRDASRHTKTSSRRSVSQTSRRDEGGQRSQESEQQRSSLGSRTSRRPPDNASRKSRHSEQDADDRVSSRRSGHSKDDQSENRRYREHQSDLSQRSRRNSYRRPEYLEVHEEEKFVEDWGGSGVQRDGSVQW